MTWSEALHDALAALCLAAVITLAGCDDSPDGPGWPTPLPTPTAKPGSCPFQVAIEPLQVAGAYFVKADPPGTFTAVVGATIYGVPDEGMVLYGQPGDIVSACRPCGCALPVPLP